MNCLDFRRAALSDPAVVVLQYQDHLQSCVSCRNFAQQTVTRDAATRQALEIPFPDELAHRILLRQALRKRPSRHWITALAAVLVLGIGVTLFGSFFVRNTLPDTLVNHIEHEAHQVHGKSGTISQADFSYTLARAGARISAQSTTAFPQVVYASNCVIEGQLIAHFVIENASGQFTVLLLPAGQGSQDFGKLFARGSWHGVIEPIGSTNLAIIADNRVRESSLREVARDLGNSIRVVDA